MNAFKRISLFALVFLLAQTGSAKNVKLAWKKMADVKNYHFQVAPENTFENPVLDKTTHKNSLGADLPVGTYYLRVQGIYAGGGHGEWSQPFKLVVTAALESSRDVEKISYEDASQPISVTWNQDPQATIYKVVVEKNGKEISSQEVSLSTFTLNADGPGRYRVKVRSGVDGNYGPENVIRTLVVQEPPKAAEMALVETRKAVSAPDSGDPDHEFVPMRPHSVAGAPPAPREVSVTPQADAILKKWFVDVGPVFSNNFLGSNGTKYDIFLGILMPYEELIDFRIFYDGNFNTASQGSTGESEVGAGVDFFLSDRMTPESFYISLDLGYGGGNRNYDAFLMVGGGFGYQFYRTHTMSFEVQFHFSELLSNSGNFTSNPSWQTLRIGARF